MKAFEVYNSFYGNMLNPDGTKKEIGSEPDRRKDYDSAKLFGDGWYFFPDYSARAGVSFPTRQQLERLAANCETMNLNIYKGGPDVDPNDTRRDMVETARQFKSRVELVVFNEHEGNIEWDLSGRMDIFTRADAMRFAEHHLVERIMRLRQYFRPDDNNDFAPDSLAEAIAYLNPDGLRLCSWSNRLWLLHLLCRAGIDTVTTENGAWYQNSQLAISYLRGAAAEYGKGWGVWVSPFGGVCHNMNRGLTCYDENGVLQAGLTASLQLRIYMTAFLSGARFVLPEENNFTNWAAPDFDQYAPNKTYFKRVVCNSKGVLPATKLSPLGEMAKRFHNFAKLHRQDIGEPLVPFAFLIDSNQGWDPNGTWVLKKQVFGNRVPYSQGDYMMDNLFNFIYPGFRISGMGFYKNFNDEVDWQSEKEYCSKLYSGFDQRPLEKGFLVNTPYSAGFDVMDNKGVQIETIKRYKVVILAGDIILQKRDYDVLKHYVNEGGTLVANIFHVAPRPHLRHPDIDYLSEQMVTELFGVTLPTDNDTNPLAWGDMSREPSCCHQCRQTFMEYNNEFAVLGAERSAGTMISTESGTPLVTTNKAGNGNAMLFTQHWYQSTGLTRLTDAAQHAFDHLFKQHLPVQIDDGIHFQINRSGKGLIVSLMNHNRNAWKGSIRLPDNHDYSIVRDIWNNEEIAMRPGMSALNTVVQPFDFRIFELSKSGK